MPIYSPLSVLQRPLVIWPVYVILVYWTATLLVNLQELGTLVWSAAMIISVVVLSMMGLVVAVNTTLNGMKRLDNTCDRESMPT